MKLGKRMIPLLAIALLFVPRIFAEDAAKPADSAKKDGTASSAAVPKPAGKALSALPASSSGKPHGTQGAGAGSGRHRARMDREEAIVPKVELFLGYSYWRGVPQSSGNRIGSVNGGSTSLAFNVNSHLGLVFDFAGYSVDSVRFTNPGAGFSPSRSADADGNVYSLLFGPRISFRDHARLTPFLQVLGGAARATQVTVDGCHAPIYACAPLSQETVFALTAGGGLDYRLTHRIALRLFQAEYLLTRFQDPSSLAGDSGWQNNIRLSSGLVFRFGGNPAPIPNRAPIVSCSVDRATLYAGSGEFATVHAAASDPDNDSLSFAWRANGGAVDGSGPDGRWNSSGVASGSYVVSVRVDDGRGGTADCSVDIRLELQPNRAPRISCSADRGSLIVGETAQITATASDPDNDPLTYSWTAGAGRIRGTDASARFESAGLKAGHYSVMGHVDDGRGGVADCQLGIEVQDPPPSHEMVELETRLALHSIYFATARPTVANPTGGLVASQEQILVKLAEDFQRYLTFKPEARLTLGGHADHRGSVPYNKALTERRVERSKSFLVEHGVSAAAIDTQAFGEQDNLTEQQVKDQIAQNPDLNDSERQQMMDNLKVLVLANNRRVDVTLSTTGQQSTRRYPFNARDYLALISTKGTGRDRAAKPRTRKKQQP